MSGTTYVDVGQRGRVVIPASVRRELGLQPGVRLLARIVNQALVLMPVEAIDTELFAMFRDYPGSLADELVAERHAEAARERS
jgi:AbrB family looped-hinge helix DNA binding protein